MPCESPLHPAEYAVGDERKGWLLALCRPCGVPVLHAVYCRTDSVITEVFGNLSPVAVEVVALGGVLVLQDEAHGPHKVDSELVGAQSRVVGYGHQGEQLPVILRNLDLRVDSCIEDSAEFSAG